MLLAEPISHTGTEYMDFVEVFNISLDLSTVYCANFSGWVLSFLCTFIFCHYIPECYNLFSGDKLTIRSFCFISARTTNRIRLNLFNQWFLCFKRNPEGSNFPYNISGRCHLFVVEF